MKLKKYFEMNDDDIDDDIDDTEDLDIDEIEELGIDDVEDVNQDDVIENLLSTLRKMIKNSGFDNAYVFTDDEGCINVQFVLNKTEKIAGVMKIMNLLKKLETDILIQYDSEFDLWETKDSDPLITAKFFYDENVSAPTTMDQIDEEVPF